ncbi:MAG: transposase [Gemmatimonadetes bacterium]|nr:transposase [Gemmatimonadota bacterium]
MARKKRPAADPQEAAALETLLAQVQTPEQLEAVFRRLKQRMVERVLQAELTEHLGYAPGAGRGPDGNARNGTTPKTVLTDEGALPLAIPRDREGASRRPSCPRGAPAAGLRPEGPVALRPGPDGAGAAGAPGGVLPGGGVAGGDHGGDRRGAGRGGGVAAAAAGAGVHRRRARRAPREDPDRGAGAAAGDLPGAGHPAERREGGAGFLARGGGEGRPSGSGC